MKIKGQTREQPSLCPALSDTSPPSLENFFDLLDNLAFYETDLVVFGSLITWEQYIKINHN
jgi:hypothetical protein